MRGIAGNQPNNAEPTPFARRSAAIRIGESERDFRADRRTVWQDFGHTSTELEPVMPAQYRLMIVLCFIARQGAFLMPVSMGFLQEAVPFSG